EEERGPGHGEVGLVGGEDAQSGQPVTTGGPVGRVGGATSARFGIFGIATVGLVGVIGQSGEDVFAGEEQRLEVRLGAAGGEDPVTVGEAEVSAGPVDEAAFHEGGDLGLVVGVDRGV